MAHYYADPNLAPVPLKETLNTAPEGVGPTGHFPDGKLNEHDQGEIAFAITADKTNNLVLINFATPVAFLCMSAKESIELGRLLLAKAAELEG